jgi:hypothetical protein
MLADMGKVQKTTSVEQVPVAGVNSFPCRECTLGDISCDGTTLKIPPTYLGTQPVDTIVTQDVTNAEGKVRTALTTSIIKTKNALIESASTVPGEGLQAPIDRGIDVNVEATSITTSSSTGKDLKVKYSSTDDVCTGKTANQEICEAAGACTFTAGASADKSSDNTCETKRDAKCDVETNDEKTCTNAGRCSYTAADEDEVSKCETTPVSAITSITVTKVGTGYAVGDKITIKHEGMPGRDTDAVFTLTTENFARKISIDINPTNDNAFDRINKITVGKTPVNKPIPTSSSRSYEPFDEEKKEQNCKTPVWPWEGKVTKETRKTYECVLFRPELTPPEFTSTNAMCGGVDTAAWDLFAIPRLVSCYLVNH